MIDDFEKPERPMYRLEQVCFNCRFFRRKKYNKYSRFGYCTLAKYQYAEIKKLPKEKRVVYYDETPIDASCDMHQFKGGGFIHTASKFCGAYPIHD